MNKSHIEFIITLIYTIGVPIVSVSVTHSWGIGFLLTVFVYYTVYAIRDCIILMNDIFKLIKE